MDSSPPNKAIFKTSAFDIQQWRSGSLGGAWNILYKPFSIPESGCAVPIVYSVGTVVSCYLNCDVCALCGIEHS